MPLQTDLSQDCTAADPPTGMKEATSTAAGATVIDGDTLTYFCADGYTTGGGSGVITCTAGTFSPLLSDITLTCTANPCIAEAPPIGMKEATSTAAGATVNDGVSLTYSCGTGYTAGGGSGVITCTGGTFSPLLSAITLTCTASPSEDQVGDLGSVNVVIGVAFAVVVTVLVILLVIVTVLWLRRIKPPCLGKSTETTNVYQNQAFANVTTNNNSVYQDLGPTENPSGHYQELLSVRKKNGEEFDLAR
ncbi:hypothetical protein ScPMuIL_016185 [Solemya velum]